MELRILALVSVLGMAVACNGDKDDTGEPAEPNVNEITNIITLNTTTTVTITDTGEPVDPLVYIPVIADCVATVGNICPWAGQGYNGFNGDVATHNLWFSFPMGVEISPYGDPVIADWNNHKLRVLTDFQGPGTGTIRTVMGTDFLGDGDPARADLTDEGAPGTEVNLNHPTEHEYAPDGILYSASWHTHKIRTWDPATDLVHVIAGLTPGYLPLDQFGPMPTTGKDARFNQLKQLHLGANNVIYINDMRNERVRKWDRDAGTLQTILGSGVRGIGGDGGPPTAALINLPNGTNPEPGGAMAFSADEMTMYFADTLSNCIRVVDFEANTVDTLSGLCHEVGGNVVGSASKARFNYPVDLALDEVTGELFVADANNNQVKVIDVTDGSVSVFAGTGDPTCIAVYEGVPAFCDEQHTAGDGGPSVDATLYRPFAVELDLGGNLVISDTYNHRIRIAYRY